MHLAALLCFFSTLFMLDWIYGLHTGEAYSTGSDQSIVNSLLYALMFVANISSYEADMCIPG